MIFFSHGQLSDSRTKAVEDAFFYSYLPNFSLSIHVPYTVKKTKKIFLIYRKFRRDQLQSYMRKASYTVKKVIGNILS
jgi:hypothetical protein